MPGLNYLGMSETLWPSAKIATVSERLDTLLRVFSDMRERQKLTSDEIMIFLAVGRLGIAATPQGVTMRPVTCLDISQLLKIPTETVRRKAVRLEKIHFVRRTTRGIAIQNLDEWRRLAEMLTI